MQSLLAAHPRIVSFPESSFFARTIGNSNSRMFGRSLRGVNGMRRRLRESLGIASSGSRRSVRQFLQEIGREDLICKLPQSRRRIKPQTQAFLAILDQLAADAGAQVWVEKSPEHLHYIQEIERFAPDARFLHLVRSGPDVVASLYDVAKRYPDMHWGRFYTDIDQCIERWGVCVRTTRECLARPNHLLVRYESLVAETEQTVRDICSFLGVEFVEDMIANREDAVSSLVTKKESWKSGVRGQIVDANASKFQKLFNESEQRHIVERIESFGELPQAAPLTSR